MGLPVYIYVLSNPETGEIRYVGVTRNPKLRAVQHVSVKDASHKSMWVKSLRAQGLKPNFTVIEVCNEANWGAREQFWIAIFRVLLGDRLTNGDAGGLNRLRHTDEMRAKISATLKGRPAPEKWRAVHAYALDGRYVAMFPSLTLAASLMRVDRPNISRAIANATSAGDHFWSYEKLDTYCPRAYVNGRPEISDETRKKLSAVATGRGTGRLVTDETRARQRESALRRWGKL